jgi:hypothetical protein
VTAMLDRSVVEVISRAAQHQPGRLLATVAATWLLAVPILAVLWLAARAVRRREAHLLSLLVLAAVGAVAADSRHHAYARGRCLCWWARTGSNCGPLPCEFRYGLLQQDSRPWKRVEDCVKPAGRGG